MAVYTERTGLSRSQLANLLTQDLSTAEQAAEVGNSFFINSTGEGLPPLTLILDDSNPDEPFQKIQNLSNQRLDRLSRFIRLSAHFTGTYANLDWAMKASRDEEITPSFLQDLATLEYLVADTGLAADAVTGFWYQIKTIGRGNARYPRDLFDRIFNNPALLQGRDPYSSLTPFDPARDTRWEIEGNDPTNAELRSRLTAALRVSSDDLTTAARYQLSLNGATGDVLFLNLGNLSSLYRLTKQAALLGTSLDEFFLLAGLIFYPDSPYLEPPKNALPAKITTTERLRSANAWLEDSPFTVYQIQYILTGDSNPYVFPGYLVSEIGPFIDRLAVASEETRLSPESFTFVALDTDEAGSLFDQLVSEGFLTELGILLSKEAGFDALSFLFPVTDTAFVVQGGLISPAQSKEAFGQLVDEGILLVTSPEATSGVLSSTYTPQTSLDFLFVGEPQAPAMREQVRGVLNQTRSNILQTVEVMAEGRVLQNAAMDQGLSEFLDTDAERIALLVPTAATAAQLPDYLKALLTPLGKDPVPNGVPEFIAALARYTLLFDKLDMDLLQIRAVMRGPQYFNIEDVSALTFANLRSLTTYLDLESDFQDVNQVLIRCYFAIVPIGECPSGTSLEVLSQLTGWPLDQIVSLQELFWPSSTSSPPPWETVEGLAVLQRVFALSSQTTMDTFALQSIAELANLKLRNAEGQLIQANWETYEATAQATLSAVAARYGDPEFDGVYREIEGQLLVEQRDALLGYALWTLSGEPGLGWIRKPSDLYQYLLIDVEMSGCDSTSYIAQGISSVQLYLQRARMNLEPGVTDIPIPDVWWTWISTYRIWEANRKIYLYPENYADPNLLRGASPIYYDFSKELLQNEIDDAHVTQAFNDYFTQLAELAGLVPCASYFSATEDPLTQADVETVFFLGRTLTEPYTYFYRSLTEGKIWSPWQAIDLSINSACLTAAFAYDRLFIFWSEFTQNNSSAIKSSDAEPQSTVHAALKYSFQDASGTWVQPQTLVSDFVVNAYPSNYDPMNTEAIAELFESDQLPWTRPHVYRFERGIPGSGRITITANLDLVKGIDTQFQRQIKKGDRILCQAQEREVFSVLDDNLVVDSPWTLSAKSAEFKIIPQDPDVTRFPSFSGSGKILVTENLDLVKGDGDTLFQLEIQIGDRISLLGETRTVLTVLEKELLVDLPWSVGSSEYQTYTITPGTKGSERLLIVYGTGLDTANRVDPGTRKEDRNPGRDPFLESRNRFNRDLYASLVLASRITEFQTPSGQAASGDVSMGPSVVLYEGLNQEDGSFLTLDYGYSADYQSSDHLEPYSPFIDRNNSILTVGQRANVIVDNYWANSAPNTLPALLPPIAGESLPLLYNLPSQLSWITNVSNQVGSFVFGTGEESFWVQSTEQGLKRLSEIMLARPFLTSAGTQNEQLLSAGAYTPTPKAFNQLQFSFTRLSTTVVDRLSNRLLAFGLDGLLSLESQVLPELPFSRFYNDETREPAPAIDTQNLPPELMDFKGSYGLYFWEVFFYNVFLVANRLNANQRFEEAKGWYEYIFNPHPIPDTRGPQPRRSFLAFPAFSKPGSGNTSGNPHRSCPDRRLQRRSLRSRRHRPAAPGGLPQGDRDALHRQSARLGRSTVPPRHPGDHHPGGQPLCTRPGPPRATPRGPGTLSRATGEELQRHQGGLRHVRNRHRRLDHFHHPGRRRFEPGRLL